MRKIFFIFFIIFTVSSCTYEDSGFKQISKEEAMETWAWKIFIFTDEGEIQSIESTQNNFDNSIEEKTIFADDIWKKNLRDDLFLNTSKVAIEEEAYNAIFKQVKNKK